MHILGVSSNFKNKKSISIMVTNHPKMVYGQLQNIMYIEYTSDNVQRNTGIK
jgi:hypothetical protein